MDNKIDFDTWAEAARIEIERQLPHDEKYHARMAHGLKGVFGETPTHENAYHLSLCVWRMVRARVAAASGECSPECYAAVVILVADNIPELSVIELGKPAQDLAAAGAGFAKIARSATESDRLALGMNVEAFVQFCVNTSIMRDATTGFKLLAGSRKGQQFKKSGPTDQALYEAYVRVRSEHPSNRAAQLAVADEFGLRMPPSDAGRRRVYRAVKKLSPQK